MALTEYRVQSPGPVQVPSGRVGLTVEQARRRLHAIRPTEASVAPSAFRGMAADDDAGTWEVAQPIQFKVGEVFRWDGIPPKAEPVRPEAEVPEADEVELQRQVEALGIEYRVAPIRDALTDLGIGYADRDRKADLARRLVENAELAG